MPEPVCESANHTFANFNRVLSNSTYYTGNATEYDWTIDEGQIINTNSSGGEMALILTETNGGTRVSSTRYVHYATITTRLKTGRWAGVVTAFITMSNIKDEIDWEFPGANTTQGQTNFFWQGVIPPTTAGEVSGDISDTFSNYHDYTIDWQPDTLTWSIDNKVVRTLKKSDTIDSNGVAHYPTTPARIQLSLWPAGIPSEPSGTVTWAGGMIDWTNPDYTAAGHFYALVSSVNIQCADPVTPSGNVTSYIYGSNSSSFTPGINFSNATTVNSAIGTHPSSSWKPVAAIVTGLLLLHIVL
jgi:beta-glucanase (GH16 family)